MALSSGGDTSSLGQFNTSPNGPLDMSAYITGVGEQAKKSWQNQDEMLDWAKKQFAKNEGNADTVSKRALDTSSQFGDYANRDQAEYNTYQPARKSQLDFAMNYTTPERMAANRAGAGAQSQIATQATRDASERALQGLGVDPSSGRFAGLDAGLQANAAARSAAAMTKSDRDTEAMGQEYLDRAIKTGAVLPGQAVNEAGIGIAAGNQAVNAPLAATASGAATMGTPLQWNTTGNAMYNQWPGAANLQYQAGRQSNQDTFNDNLAMMKLAQGSSSGTGAALGAGAGILGMLGKGMGGMGGITNMFGGGGGGDVSAAGGAYSMGDATSMASGAGMGGMFARRGGMVKRFDTGGRVKKFDMGGGIGFNPMSYIGDFANIGMEIGGGDQGETESPQTPMDPASGLWDAAYGVPHEKYDEGERVGSSIGRPIGRAIGDYFTGGIGSGAFAEGFGRAGGAVGAGVQGHFGEAVNDLTQGTPLSFIKLQQGGSVPDEEDMTDQYNTDLSPEEEQRYHQWAEQNNRQKDTFDYDMRGAWKQGERGDPSTGHFPDTYKKPNHPTFSDQRRYHGAGGRMGGRWDYDETGSETLQPYDPRYHADGGKIAMINSFANGGDIPPDDEMAEGPQPPEEEMGEGEGSNMVPPEASPSGGADVDDVHAMVSEGEFVMPKDVTSWFGEKFMQNLINKARKEMAGPKAEGEEGPPMQAMALSPPSFHSEGARMGA
jgi:hypothetical protein